MTESEDEGQSSDASDEYGPSRSRKQKRQKTTRQSMRKLAGMADGDSDDSDSAFMRVNSRSGQQLPNYNEENMHAAFSDSDDAFGDGYASAPVEGSYFR